MVALAPSTAMHWRLLRRLAGKKRSELLLKSKQFPPLYICQEVFFSFFLLCNTVTFLFQHADDRARCSSFRGHGLVGGHSNNDWVSAGISSSHKQVTSLWSLQPGRLLQEDWDLPGASQGFLGHGQIPAEVTFFIWNLSPLVNKIYTVSQCSRAEFVF